MGKFWGAVTEITDLGVVAERCPHCDRMTSCLLRSVCRGDFIFFVKMGEPDRESSCLCTGCLKPFPGQPYWQYATVVPIAEAQKLPLEALLEQTNPILAERLQFQEQICGLGGDERFAKAYELLEALRPGALRSGLLQQLLDWNRLEEEQRCSLGEHIGTRARAWQFARHVARCFPGSAICLLLVVAALIVGAALFLVPALRHGLWATVTVVAGIVGAVLVDQKLQTRWVRQWTRATLIPEASEAGVSIECFLAVVDDVPGSRLGLTDDLWPIKDQLETIRQVLSEEGYQVNADAPRVPAQEQHLTAPETPGS